MPKREAQDCMFCQMGDCETHAPKPKAARLPKPAAAPVRRGETSPRDSPRVPAPVKRQPPLVDEGSGRLRELQAKAGDEEKEYNEVLATALRSLLPLLAPQDIQSNRELIGPDADKWLRLHRWRRRIKDGR